VFAPPADKSRTKEDKTMSETATADTLDLLYGVPRIAAFLGVTERTAYHLIDTKRLPHFRMGKILCARKSTLTKAMSELEQQSVA
jgi:excisionase family DNA binding protein